MEISVNNTYFERVKNEIFSQFVYSFVSFPFRIVMQIILDSLYEYGTTILCKRKQLERSAFNRENKNVKEKRMA